MDAKEALRIAKLAFPEWKGRKIKVETVHEICLMNRYWDGGSRSQYRAVNLDTHEVGGPQIAGFRDPPQFGGLSQDPTIPVPVGFAIVEHCIFCGKDVGCTVSVGSPPALPVPDSEYHARLTEGG